MNYIHKICYCFRLLPVVIYRVFLYAGEKIRYAFFFCCFKKIGKSVHISRWVSFGGIYNIEIGDNVSINQGCSIYGDFGVKIGNNVKLSPFVQIFSANYILRKNYPVGSFSTRGSRVTIGDGSWVGANSVILPGVIIGKNCVVGALSLVNKNIPDNEIWAGNPAKFIKRMPN